MSDFVTWSLPLLLDYAHYKLCRFQLFAKKLEIGWGKLFSRTVLEVLRSCCTPERWS